MILIALLWNPGLGDADMFIKLSMTTVAGAIFIYSSWMLRRLIDEKPPPISVPSLGIDYDGKAPASEFRAMVDQALKNARRLEKE